PLLLLGNRAYMNAIGGWSKTPMRDSAGEIFFRLESSTTEEVPRLSDIGATDDTRRPSIRWSTAGDSSTRIAGGRGFRFGLGRIVVLSTPQPLRNDVFRQCAIDAATPAVRALEFLGNGRNRRLVFDEYRQGYGERTGIWSV